VATLFVVKVALEAVVVVLVLALEAGFFTTVFVVFVLVLWAFGIGSKVEK
jgi:uncharacterized membrane protein